jgi:formyl-CoA transferase
MLAAQMQEAAMSMMADSDLNWAAMPLTGVFETRDGAVVVVSAFKKIRCRQFAALELQTCKSSRDSRHWTAQIKHGDWAVS